MQAYKSTHGHLLLLCFWFAFETARFRCAKNKASNKRLFHKYSAHPSPPLSRARDFTGVGERHLQKY